MSSIEDDFTVPSGPPERADKVIDDIEKVEKETTIQLLNELGITFENAEKILSLFRELYEKTPTEAMVYLKDYGFTDKQICEGISELDCVVNGVIANGVNEKYFKVDARIARGLDYYTGTVYETNLLDHMEIGSCLLYTSPSPRD